jgi:hydroxymethylpyrimidine pyrophosphatase-like HAD family hydrolase
VLLASDFDNTLIYTEEALRSGGAVPSLSPGNRQALEYFTANGGRFAIATGRALAAFEGFAGDLPMNAPGVVCNGAAIYDFAKGEYLETALLDGQVRARGQVLLDLFPGVAVEAYHIGNVIHAVHPNAVTRRHEHITHVGVEERPSLAEVPLPLGKLLFEGEHAELEALRSELRRQGWDADYELIFSNPFLLELTRRGGQQGRHGAAPGRAAGRPPGEHLLRRGRGQRHLHAHRRGPGLCPCQLRARGAGLRRHGGGRRPGRRHGRDRLHPGPALCRAVKPACRRTGEHPSRRPRGGAKRSAADFFAFLQKGVDKSPELWYCINYLRQ